MDRIKELENSLTIVCAQADHIRVDDTRRLTGPGLMWDLPGAVIDVFFDDAETDEIAGLWQIHATECWMHLAGRANS